MKVVLILSVLAVTFGILIYIRRKEKWHWYEPENTTPKEQCSCCDYITLLERGSHLICPVCFWEDDGTNIDKPDIISGCNHLTLREARTNFKKFGACDEKMLKFVISSDQRKNYTLKKRELGTISE